MTYVNRQQIKEMVSRGQEDALFNELLNEFNHTRPLACYSDSHLAKLIMMKWVKIAGQDPARMSEALKEYLK